MNYYAPLERSIVALAGLIGESHVRAGNATYRDPDTGLISIASAQTPRFESVGGRRALLIEPGATNLIADSEDFSQWTTSNVSIAADVTGPNGTANDATTVTDDDVGAGDYLYLAFNPASDNEKYTASIYVKEGTSADFTVIVRDTGVPTTRAEIDFEWSSGSLTVKSEDTGTGAVEQVGSTFWWRAIVYVPASVIVEANTHEMWFYPTENGRQAAETTIIWGAQVEEFPVPTSYIPTSGATASRTTESGYPLWTLPTGLFDAQGTCSVWVRFGWGETDMPQDGTRTNSGIIVTRDNASSLVFVEHDSDFTTNASFSSFDGTAWAMKEYNFIANTWYKLVVKWSSTTSKMRAGVDIGAGIVWGVEVAFDGSYTLGASLRLGYSLFGPMWLQDLMLFDRLLTDDEIDAGPVFGGVFHWHQAMYRY